MSQNNDDNPAPDAEEVTVRVDVNSKSESRGPGSRFDPWYDLRKIGDPLARDERDLAKYDEIWMGVTEALIPQDYIEGMLMLDVVDRQWELLLLRRRMACVLARKTWAANDIRQERESAAPNPERRNAEPTPSTPDASDDMAEYERLLRLIDGVAQCRRDAIAEVDRYREMMKTYLDVDPKRMERQTIDYRTYRRAAPIFRSMDD
jgi:hypothetical protein